MNEYKRKTAAGALFAISMIGFSIVAFHLGLVFGLVMVSVICFLLAAGLAKP